MKRQSWKSFRLQRAGLRGVIFGFQHEDQQVEQEVLTRTRGERALCICSGGEVAMGLIAQGAEQVVAIDVNPAQLELFEIKRRLIGMGKLEDLDGDARGAESLLSGRWVDRDFKFTPTQFRHGLCFSGQVEQRAIRLSPLLRWFSKDVRALRWRIGWQLIPMAVWLGYAAVFRRYLPDGWSERMKARAEAVIESGGNLWWSVEKGERFGNFGNPLYQNKSLIEGLQRVELRKAGLEEVLAEEALWDLVAVSNVIDTMSESERVSLLQSARSRLREGGRVVVRSMLFTSEDLPQIPGIVWEALPEDRSPICPVIGAGRVD